MENEGLSRPPKQQLLDKITIPIIITEMEAFEQGDLFAVH